MNQQKNITYNQDSIVQETIAQYMQHCVTRFICCQSRVALFNSIFVNNTKFSIGVNNEY
jgi:hypothetical protein